MIIEASPSDRILAALRQRGTRVRRVRYRLNRAVLLSVSPDGRTLNIHECFREAPRRIVDAVATFVVSARHTGDYRRALAQIRGWEGASAGVERARRRVRRRPPVRGRAGELERLGRLYAEMNRTRFGGTLPEVPLRVSARMTRALGTISYSDDGARRVREIAISADLLLPENRAILHDTLLHEMAHAEAWLRHGHRGHGRIWRRIAERVGCLPRALTWTPVRRRNRSGVRA